MVVAPILPLVPIADLAEIVAGPTRSAEIRTAWLPEIGTSWLSEIGSTWLSDVRTSWLPEIWPSWLPEIWPSWLSYVWATWSTDVRPSWLSDIGSPRSTNVWLSRSTNVRAIAALAWQTVVRPIADPAVARSETVTGTRVRGQRARHIPQTRPIASAITEEIGRRAAGQRAAESGGCTPQST